MDRNSHLTGSRVCVGVYVLLLPWSYTSDGVLDVVEMFDTVNTFGQ